MTTKKNSTKNVTKKAEQPKSKQPKTEQPIIPEYTKGRKATEVRKAFGACTTNANNKRKSGGLMWWINGMNQPWWDGDKVSAADTAKALAFVGATKWSADMMDWFGGKVADFKAFAHDGAQQEAIEDWLATGGEVEYQVKDEEGKPIFDKDGHPVMATYKTDDSKIMMAGGLQWTFGEVAGIGEGWALSKLVTVFDDRTVIRSAKAKALRVAQAEDKAYKAQEAANKAAKNAEDKAKKEAERKAKKEAKEQAKKEAEQKAAAKKKAEALAALGITEEQLAALMAAKAAQ